MQNLLEDLKHVLQKDDRLVAEGKLLKNKIVELALQLDPFLIRLLLLQPNIKKHFFVVVDDVLVFDKVLFQKFVSNKAFLPDSYTAYKNKIGLDSNDQFIADTKNIVISFPYKDCILQGQSADENARNEMFINKTLAPDEVDRLLEEKVLTNFERIAHDGKTLSGSVSVEDNLLIKGNNLVALHSIKSALQPTKQTIKLIYIDPPYNTGNDDFGYNDSFNHSTWLTFMKNRLEVARDLLSDDGSIWINIDDVEAHYLKVLCDEIFGRRNFVANVIWQKKFAPQNDAKYFSDNHDHILVYAKNKLNWKPNLLERSEKSLARYSNADNDARGPWASGGLDVKTYSASYDYPITTPSGRTVKPPKGSCWRVSKERFQQLVDDNRIWFGNDGNNVPRLKRFLSEVKQGQTPLTIWLHTEVGHNQEAKQELNKLLETDLFKTPKPERLLKQVIEIGSSAGDIVLDFFAGSGTTAAVAMKLKRRFIAIEQMDYIETVTKMRLQKVALGEQGGISKLVEWKGGGEFVYCQLAKANQGFIDEITRAGSKKEVLNVLRLIKQKAFLNYQVSMEAFDEEEFEGLSMIDQKRLLIEVLDSNMLYVPLSEIEDGTYNIALEVKQLNYSFYSREL